MTNRGLLSKVASRQDASRLFCTLLTERIRLIPVSTVTSLGGPIAFEITNDPDPPMCFWIAASRERLLLMDGSGRDKAVTIVRASAQTIKEILFGEEPPTRGIRVWGELTPFQTLFAALQKTAAPVSLLESGIAQ